MDAPTLAQRNLVGTVWMSPLFALQFVKTVWLEVQNVMMAILILMMDVRRIVLKRLDGNAQENLLLV